MNEYALGIPLAPMHSGYTETSGEVALSQDLLNMQICRLFSSMLILSQEGLLLPVKWKQQRYLK
jgi:hypothetical protein